MAVGSYDANGIWQYGESDNISPASTLLNKLAASASSGFTADRARLATLEAGSLAGLIPVKPTSVTAVTGTVATSTIGTVTFTGCTKVILTGVFTALYKNYRIVISVNSGTSDVDMLMKLSSAGTENSSSYYAAALRSDEDGSSSIRSQKNVVGGIFIGWCNATYTSEFVIDVTRPAQAGVTNITYNCIGRGGGVIQSLVGGGQHLVASAFDGFSINLGTSSGTVTVYGYNN